MVSRPEAILSGNLRTVLAPLGQGETIDDSSHFRDALSALAYFLQAALQAEFPDWQYEGVDAIYVRSAVKTGDNEAELFGLCLLISDQTLTPLHVRLRVAESSNEVAWFDCKIGQRAEGNIQRVPYDRTKLSRYLHRLDRASIEWMYHVTLGA